MNQRTIFLADLGKFQRLVQNLESHILLLKSKLEEAKTELQAKEIEKEEALKEKEQLQQILNSQEVNLADVERMNMEKATLEEQVSNMIAQKESLEKVKLINFL